MQERKEKTTVIFFCRQFSPHIGGVEKHVHEVGKRLVSGGIRLIVVTELPTTFFPEPAVYEVVDGIEVYRIPAGSSEKRKKWVIWRWLWEYRSLLQSADIVHCHDVFFWYLPFRFLFFKKRVYTTFHGYESYPIRWQAKVMRKIAEMLSFGNICIGDFISKWYGTKPTAISYGGVKIFSHKSVPEFGTALFWGRLDSWTGILTYEAATVIIGKEYTQFKFRVIGDGEMSKKIPQEFLLSGFRENVTEYLNNYQFAFVSSYLSILESLAMKRLVFAVYDNPMKEDYLKMAVFAPYIVIAKDPKELAERVLFYLRNPQAEQDMVSKGFAWVKTQTWDAVMQTYAKLWDIKM